MAGWEGMIVALPMAAESPSAHSAPRRVIVVLGMHRSGTSAVAGSLQRLGVDFGPRLMPATEANTRGYYEHVDIVNVHDRLLLALGRSWDDTSSFPEGWWLDEAVAGRYRAEVLALLRRDFPMVPVWGFKDPRLCRMLDWWDALWKGMDSEPLFVLVRRAPAQVAASLAKREGFSAAKSYLLWLQHNLEAERGTRRHARVIVDYDEFLHGNEAVLARVERALGQRWPEASGGAFVDPELNRSRHDPAASAALPRWVAEADQALMVGRGGEEGQMRAELDRIAANLREAELLYAPPISSATEDVRQQLEASRRQALWYEAEWQKARGRANDAREQLAARKLEIETLKSKILHK